MLFICMQKGVRDALENIEEEDERKRMKVSLATTGTDDAQNCFTTSRPLKHDMAGAIIEDEVDIFINSLSAQTRSEPSDDPSDKYLSFHSYIRKRLWENDKPIGKGKYLTLENLRCKIRSNCSDHQPWPRGICFKCQPTSMIIEKQKYRHVDFVQFENHFIVERFLDYWRKTGNQRLGYLYGRYEYHKGVPLGIKAVVSAIYEPLQMSTSNTLQLLQDEDGVVDQIAEKFNQMKIGWIFTDLVPLDISCNDSNFLTFEACKMAANFQTRHPNPCTLSPDGYLGSKFVSIIVAGDSNGYQLHAFQATEQCAALVRDDCFVSENNEQEFGKLRESSGQQYIPGIYVKVTDESGNDRVKLTQSLSVEQLTVNIPVSIGVDISYTFSASDEIVPFPIEHRDDFGEEQNVVKMLQYISQNNEKQMDIFYDLHLLRYMATCNISTLTSTFDDLLLALKFEDKDLFDIWLKTVDWVDIECLLSEHSEFGENLAANIFERAVPYPGNPYLILFDKVCDTSCIEASGSGLIKGFAGQPGTFVVKLKNSQSGILRVAINGPSTPTDVALKCSEMSDGYEFTYVPSVNGIHFVCVEFGDRHVAGSPFKVHVTDSSDESLTDDEEEEDNSYKCEICKVAIREEQWCSTLQCRHKFHYLCLYQWTLVQTTCPLCRRKIAYQR